MCHHRYHRAERESERLAAPAPPSGPVRVSDAERERVAAPASSGPIRVGDAERERVAALLRDHAAAGRLDADELEERLERVYAARYGTELDATLAELPGEPRTRRASEPRHGPAPWRAAPLLPLAIGALIAVAAVTGAWWLLWLIWPVVVVLGPKRHYRRAARY